MMNMQTFANDNRFEFKHLTTAYIKHNINMLHYQPTYSDQSLDPLITQILPQLEQSIKAQLLIQLQEQAKLQFETEYRKIQTQALQQYQLALHDLEEQGRKLQAEQINGLQQEISKLKKQKIKKQQAHTRALQDRYVSENFQDKILQHPTIKQIQQQLAIQIYESSQQKIENTKQRRIRELAIKMQNKEQKFKKQRQKAIRNQVCQGRSVDQLKKDIQIMKIGIASMKSEYNIKIKKIDTEIKQIKQKNKASQPKDNVTELRNKLEELQQKREELNDKILHDRQAQHNSVNNETFSHLDSSSEYENYAKPQTRFQSQRNHMLVQEQDPYEDSSSQSSPNSEQEDDQGQIVKPPAYYIPVETSQQHLETFQSHAPILRLNVASLLRTNWQDPLQRYVNMDGSNPNSKNQYETAENNQNDSKSSNKQSFQQIYHQHLQKLNQATKRRKLSVQAKKNIMKNLSMLKKTRA